ncbi:hypothetical protein KVR01_002603 [Diaporthe batatas]|uniref:uncharacterized protein n=1 Tax=Diaporthe batatas TaxID=748121 RepID=UPI001D05B3E0|nr:uncharacterized protein KVR01_002603 [Diaporthe batatas]KAG8166914.1 hypothetical protein KVR01_002603 [Diaporthe batatas]
MSQPEQPELVDASDASSVPDSSDESSGSTEELYHTTLEARIALWKIQLQQERLTPLLQKEMNSAIELMAKEIRKPRLSADIDLVEKLDSMHNDIYEHWSKVFKDPSDRSLLLVNINRYEVVLVGMLYEDYTLQSVSPFEPLLPGDPWFSDVSSHVQHHRQPKDGSTSDNDKYYQENVLFPLEEMNLGSLVSHAENRLCATAAARQAGAKGTGAYVARLIQECDWERLAETLIYDRQIYNNLCGHNTLCLNREWLESRRPTILGRMDDLQRMYYTNISSPTNYTISKHAMDLLARHSTGAPLRVPHSRVSKPQIHTSPITKIKGRLQLLADGLNMRFRKDTATSSANPEEKSHLLFQSQKGTATSSIVSDEKPFLLD